MYEIPIFFHFIAFQAGSFEQKIVYMSLLWSVAKNLPRIVVSLPM